MLSKVLMGVTAASAIALGIVFWLLLDAKEANGELRQGIADAAATNARMELAKAALQANYDDLQKDYEAERVRTQAATAALGVAADRMRNEKTEFERRLKRAIEELSDEELVCANERVPDDFIVSLHQPATSIE